MTRILRQKIRYLEDKVAGLECEVKEYETFLRYIMLKKKKLKLPKKLKTWALNKVLNIITNQAQEDMKRKLDEALFN